MKPTQDISFTGGDWRFRYRIAGVAIAQGRVLLQQIQGADYWFLPGGRCAMGESAKDCLKREMSEELNSEAEIGRLVWVAENFFKMDSRFHHELSLFFLVTFRANSPVLNTEESSGVDCGDDDIVAVRNRWHNLNGLKEITIVPPFLQTGLQDIPETTQHVVNFDR
jgi:ADP-ribose pyrophosphatase YjhB (NUDIX family)